MNKIISKYLVGTLALLTIISGLFAGATETKASSATTTCTNAVWSATLYGTVTPNGSSTEAWFEWGTNSNLDYQTPHQTFNSNSSYTQNLSPLAENTTFYYRAVARNEYGTARGSIGSFQTGQCSTPNNPPTYKTQCSDGIDNDRDGQIDMADYFCTDPGDDDERDPVPTSNPTPNPTGNIQAGNLTYQCLYNPFRIQLNWTSGSNANSNSIEKGDIDPSDSNRFWGFIMQDPSLSVRSYTDSNVSQGTSYTYRIKYAPSVPSNEVVTNCAGNPTAQNGSIGGYAVHRVSGNDLRPFGNGTTTFRLNGGSATSSNPYGFTSLTPGNYTVTADNISGFTLLGYTLCTGGSCHSGNPTTGNSANVNITSGASYSLYWQYSANDTQQAAPGNIQGYKVDQNMNAIGTTSAIRVSGATSNSSTSNPYGFSFNPGSYTITADSISGYTFKGYTLCTNSTSCHTGSPTNSSTVTINLASNTSYDLWWHYAQNTTAQTCQETGATNIGQPLPCTFPAQTCTDKEATNYGQPLPCKFPPTQTCQNTNALNYGEPLPCRFPTPNSPTVNINADDARIDSGESTTITWDSTNANSCTGTAGRKGWAGSRTIDGSFKTGALTDDTTYTIICYNSSNVSATDSVTVRVGNNGNDGPDVTTKNATGVNTTSATINGRVDGNGLSTRAWFEYGTSRSLGSRTSSSSYGNGSSNFDEYLSNLRPYTTYYFRAVAENSEDDVYGSILSFTTNGDEGNPVYPNQPTVSITSDLNTVSYNGTTVVRWYTTNANSCYASGGSTGWAGTRSIGPGSFFTGSLTSNKTYTITCTNSSGSATDTVTVYVSRPSTVTPTVRPAPSAYVIITSSVDRNQPIIATIDNTRPHPGDEINYNITYQNIGNASVTNLTLRVDLPYEVDYISSNPNNPTRSGQTLIFNLGTLRANAQGTVSIRVRVRDNVTPNTILNFPATLTYTDPSGYVQSVTANVSAQTWGGYDNVNINNTDTNTNIDNNSSLGANVLGAGFFPGSLFEWLILLILILILIVLIKYIFSQSSSNTTTTTVHH